MSSLRIEICRSWSKDLWQLRIGDIEGSAEDSMIDKKTVLDEISEKMDALQEKAE